MTPDKRTGIGDLEIDAVRRPFENVVPTKVLSESPDRASSLIIAGSRDASEEYPRMRAEMLREIFTVFPQREADVRARTLEYMKAGFTPIDAIYVAIMSVFQDSLRCAANSRPEFIRIQTLYEAMHAGNGYALGRKTAAGELQEFTGHGTAVLMGLLEAVPAVYENSYGRKPSRVKLTEMIPSCADRLLAALSRVKGVFAVEVERRLWKEERFLGYKDSTFKRFTMNPTKLAFRSVDGKDILDVTAGVTRNVRENVKIGQTQYHGCLAGLVKMPKNGSDGPPPTVFTYVKNLSAELMLEHAFSDIQDEV